MLTQGFNHTLHRKKKSSSSFLLPAQTILPSSYTLVQTSSPCFFFSPQPLYGFSPGLIFVLKTLKKKIKLGYLLSRNLHTISEI